MNFSPYLTVEEFGEACHYMDNIYRTVDLGQLRRRWKLNVHNHFDICGYQSYVSITLPVKLPDQQTDELADALERMNWDNKASNSTEVSIDYDAEMADSENLWNSKNTGLKGIMTPKQPTVTYDIIWQPSYGTPRLWFTLNDLPENYSPNDHDTVYHLLVPEEQKFIREMGVLGGISLEPHPITLKPAFFIHDCNTTEILTELAQQRGFRIPLQHYLIIWLGLVGPVVGLSVPLKMGLPISGTFYENTSLIGVSRDTDTRNVMQYSMLPDIPSPWLGIPLLSIAPRSSIGEPAKVTVDGHANSLVKTPRRIYDSFAGKRGLKPSDLLLRSKDVGLLTSETRITSSRRLGKGSDNMSASVVDTGSSVKKKRSERKGAGEDIRRKRFGFVDSVAGTEYLRAIGIAIMSGRTEERQVPQHATSNGNSHSHPRRVRSNNPSPDSAIDVNDSMHSNSDSAPLLRSFDIQTDDNPEIAHAHPPPSHSVSTLSAELNNVIAKAAQDMDANEYSDVSVIQGHTVHLRGGCLCYGLCLNSKSEDENESLNFSGFSDAFIVSSESHGESDRGSVRVTCRDPNNEPNNDPRNEPINLLFKRHQSSHENETLPFKKQRINSTSTRDPKRFIELDRQRVLDLYPAHQKSNRKFRYKQMSSESPTDNPGCTISHEEDTTMRASRHTRSHLVGANSPSANAILYDNFRQRSLDEYIRRFGQFHNTKEARISDDCTLLPSFNGQIHQELNLSARSRHTKQPVDRFITSSEAEPLLNHGMDKKFKYMDGSDGDDEYSTDMDLELGKKARNGEQRGQDNWSPLSPNQRIMRELDLTGVGTYMTF